MSCADDLTLDDLNESSSTAVLERVTAGEGSNQNLWGQIDRDNVIGVNLLEADSGPRVIKPWDDRLTESGIESGVDDELILHVPFTHSLRLRSFLFFSPSPTHPNRPGRLRLYANFANCPDFADLESIAPLMDVDISSPPVNRAGILSRGIDGRRDVEEWGLKVQKLASVHSVTLFFSEAVSGQRSSVWYVGFKGDPKNNNVDMSKLGTVPAHNAADKKVDQVADKKGAGYTTIR